MSPGVRRGREKGEGRLKNGGGRKEKWAINIGKE